MKLKGSSYKQLETLEINIHRFLSAFELKW